MFLKRTISGVVLVLIALVTIMAGGPVLIVTIAFISLLALQELYCALGIVKPWETLATDFNRIRSLYHRAEREQEEHGSIRSVLVEESMEAREGFLQSAEGTATRPGSAEAYASAAETGDLSASVSGNENKSSSTAALRPGEEGERKASDKAAFFFGVNFLTAAGLVGALIYELLLFLAPEPYYLAGVVVTLLMLLSVYVFAFPRYQAEDVSGAFFAMVYAVVMLGFIYIVRMRAADGKFVVWLIFICSWGSDTCAYLAGRAFGKHKMAPVLSPKKSVEGAIGGVLGAGLLGAVYGAVLHQFPGAYFVICSLGALFSMVGDLAASAIKRDKAVKDYGTLIPGHGGIMDRFDSVIFTAPAVYILAVLVIGSGVI